MMGFENQGPFDTLRIEGMTFVPVIALPEGCAVYDFTSGYHLEAVRTPYGIGRYDEKRPGMYLGAQFVEGCRDVHMGIDIGAPVGTPIYAFYEGRIFKLGNNPQPYDYGPTLITEHRWLDQTVYALHGHLSRELFTRWSVGEHFEAGAVLARVGDRNENGGWHPHLHFQLSLVVPEQHDLPGVVSEADRAWALSAFPDPRLVLGPLY